MDKTYEAIQYNLMSIILTCKTTQIVASKKGQNFILEFGTNKEMSQLHYTSTPCTRKKGAIRDIENVRGKLEGERRSVRGEEAIMNGFEANSETSDE